MSSSHRRSRFRARVPEEVEEEVPIAADAEESRSSGESSTEYEAELESMTGKGIKRLCWELMELKKASDEDFQRNVYLNYSAFIRIFEEIGEVKSEVVELKEHALNQMNLTRDLMSSLYADLVTDSLEETKVDEIDIALSNKFGDHMEEVLVRLDILLSECRFEEALAVFEKETLTLKKMKIAEDRSSPTITSCAYALAEKRSKLADQLALMAEHPRVSQPELQKALSGLCKLGENQRAESLLLKFYHSCLQKRVHELQCSKPCVYGTYIRELAKCVFSAISQAAKCYVALYGEPSPYSSELIQWAREETETFSHSFCTYVRSNSEISGGLSLAVDAATNAFSLCSLLKFQKLILLPNLMESIRPCMEELMQMHVDHLKKVVHIFLSTDNWTLSKFLILGILREESFLTGIGDKVEYCLLTSGGRKFVTLMQAIVDDISPLVIIKMGSSILEGLAELFIEYMCALERAIPSRGNTGNDSPKISSAQTLQQQLSLLVNASTLVQVFPSIASSILKHSENTETSFRNGLGDCILSIEESANQLRYYFCQQFVLGVMSHGDFESITSLNDWCVPGSSQAPVPSFAFQALFVRLRQLEQLSESIFVSEDEMADELAREIVEAVIVWLSKNQDFWTRTAESSSVSCVEQVYLDIYFLAEIAMHGGYCTDDIIDAAMDLIEEMEVALAETGSDPYGVQPDGEWAENAAKRAIKTLLEAEAANLEPKVEVAGSSLKELRTQNRKDECPSDAEGSIDISDGESVNLFDGGVTRSTGIKDIKPNPKCFGGQMSDATDDDDDDDDDDGSRSPDLSGSDIGELRLERLDINAEVKSVGNFEALVSEPSAEVSQVLGKQNLALENDLLENSKQNEREAIEELGAEGLTTDPESEYVGNLNEFDTNAAQFPTKEKQDVSRKSALVMSTKMNVENLQEFDAIVRQPVTEEKEHYISTTQPPTGKPVNIGLKENLMLELKKIEGTEDNEVEVQATFPQVKSVDPLDVHDDTAAKAAMDEPEYITEKINLVVDDKLINDSDASISAEVDNNPHVDLVETIRSHLEKKLDMLEGYDNPYDDLEQDGGSKVKAEPTCDFSELVPETSLQDQGVDCTVPVEDSQGTSHASVKQIDARIRSKTVADLKNFYETQSSFNLLMVKSSSLVLERKVVMPKEEAASDEFSNLPFVTRPKKQGRNKIKSLNGLDTELSSETHSLSEVLPESIDDKDKLLSDNSSRLVLATSTQIQRENIFHMERSGNTSRRSTRQRAVLKKRAAMIENNSSKKDDGSIVNTESSLITEEEREVLASKFSELAIEMSQQRQGGDGSNTVGSSRNTMGNLVRRRTGRKRTKSNVDESLETSVEGAKAPRPRWH